MKIDENDSIYETTRKMLKMNAQNEQYLLGVVEARNNIILDLIAIVEEMGTHSLDPEQFGKFEELLNEIKKRMSITELKEQHHFKGGLEKSK